MTRPITRYEGGIHPDPRLRRHSVNKRAETLPLFFETHGRDGVYESHQPFGVAIALADFWNKLYPGSQHERGGVTNIIFNLEKAGHLVVDRNPSNTPFRIALAAPATNGDTPMRIGEIIERAGDARPPASPAPESFPVPAPPKPGTTNPELDDRLNKAFDVLHEIKAEQTRMWDAIHSMDRNVGADEGIVTELGEHIVAQNTRIHAIVEWARMVSTEMGCNPPRLKD